MRVLGSPSLFRRISAAIVALIALAVAVPTALTVSLSWRLVRENLEGGLVSSVQTAAIAARSFLVNGDQDGMTMLTATLVHQNPYLGSAWIVDREQQIVAHSDPARIGTKDAAELDLAVSRVGSTSSADGPAILATSPILVSGEPWGAFAAVSSLTLAEIAIAANVQKVVWLGVVLLVLGALGAAWVARSVTKPVGHLARLADAVATGDLTVQATVASRDEVGKLAQSFNNMVAMLGTSRQQLNSYSQSLEEQTRQLAAARDAALETSRLKTDFLANMSHEIRTPLNGMLGLSELMLQTAIDADQRRMMEQLQLAGQILFDHLNDILDLSKIEAGHLELARAPLAPVEIVDQVIAAVAARAQAKSVELRRTIESTVPAWILGDSLRMRQILLNLVSNAVKFTDQGFVAVTLSGESAGVDDTWIHLTVEDTGIGIPVDKQAIVFEAFRQIDGSSTRRHGGTGLGLTICRHLVRAWGGEIWVESRLGGGTVFHVRLPVRIAPPECLHGAPQQDPEASALHVLVAEDNPINQAVLVRMLHSNGWSSEVAGTGRLAYQLWSTKSFDLVLMDIQMPEMDGVQCAAAIRAAEPGRGTRVPIIAVTAHAMSSDRNRCVEAGMDGYLTKPIRMAGLRSAILEVLQQIRCTK